MYPPPKNADEETVLRGLVESLIRAGLEVLSVFKDKDTWVIRPYEIPTKNTKTHLVSYVRSYAAYCGFKVDVRIVKPYVYVRFKTDRTPANANEITE